MEDIQADSNILLRISEPDLRNHQKAVNAVKTLLAKGDRVCLIPQNLIEYWNIATRPVDKNGFGWLPAKTDVEISRLESILTVLPDSQAIYRQWRKLVFGNFDLGKQVHDARIVAAINVHQITKLFTIR